jgi:predicted transcriptional regulator
MRIVMYVYNSKSKGKLSGSQSSYRDRIYIVKDIIMKLVEHNELNQTTLLSFCGLNLKKHKSILDELESNGFVRKYKLPFGKRTTFVYKPTPKGLEFCTTILEPYEMVFPRRKSKSNNYQDLVQHYTYAQKRDIDEVERQKNIVEVMHNR